MSHIATYRYVCPVLFISYLGCRIFTTITFRDNMEERDERGSTAVWNEVSTDFDPEEETANFGTRHALESGDNLYEVRNTLNLFIYEIN